MRTLQRMLVLLICATVGLLADTPTASAGMDLSNTLVDGHDRTLVVEQWDTFLNGVFPLDRNRLTREWFHSGRASTP